MKGKFMVAALAAVLALGTWVDTTEAAAAEGQDSEVIWESQGAEFEMADIYRDISTGTEFTMFDWRQDEFGVDTYGYADYQKIYTCENTGQDYILIVDSPEESNCLIAVAGGKGMHTCASQGAPPEMERIVAYVEAVPAEASGKQFYVQNMSTYSYEYMAYEEVDYFMSAEITSPDTSDNLVVYRVLDGTGAAVGQGVTLVSGGYGQIYFNMKYPYGTPDPGFQVEIRSLAAFSGDVGQYSFGNLSFTKSAGAEGRTYCRGSGQVYSDDVGEDSIISVGKISQSTNGVRETSSYVVMEAGAGEVWTADELNTDTEDPVYEFYVKGIIRPRDILLSQEDVVK